MQSSIQRTHADDGTATVTVHGEVDFGNFEELAETIKDAVAGSPALLRIDLHAASFIDSTGLGALIEGYRAATAADIRFLVINPTPAFRRVLIVTGLCDLFGLTEPEEEQAARTQATGA